MTLEQFHRSFDRFIAQRKLDYLPLAVKALYYGPPSQFDDMIYPDGPLRLSGSDVKWLEKALVDDDRKWFASLALFCSDPVPDRLLIPCLRSAVAVDDVSYTGFLVWPCVVAFGKDRTSDALAQIGLEVSTERDRAAVQAAFYWLNGPVLSRFGQLDGRWGMFRSRMLEERLGDSASSR
jgi:hypothetical protein